MNADQITRRSKSNLALAFFALDKERRQDITTLYAFCRVIDDISDSTETEPHAKAAELQRWRESLHRAMPGESTLAPDVRRLLAKYRIDAGMLEEIIAGVEMDLTIAAYENFEALRLYCYRVASAVGLASIEIFGYSDAGCRDYAVQLGLALQTTNIIRDVAKDRQIGRVYLPQDEMQQFGYSNSDLAAGVYDDRFVRLMQFQAERSRAFFQSAAASLPPVDRRSMAPAATMAAIYAALLRKMEDDGFRVFHKDYRLNRFEKARHVILQPLCARLLHR